MTVAGSTSQAVPLNAEEALLLAIAHHQAGRGQEAERLYRAILEFQPTHADANHNLGVLAAQVGQPGVATHHFRVALEANQGRAQFWLSYVDALIQTGQADLARQVLTQGRERGLSGPKADALSARLYGTADVAPQAGAPYPQEVETLTELFKAKRYEQAVTLARATTKRLPLHGFGWKALGATLISMGRSADALDPARSAVSLMPDDADAHNNLGYALKEQGRLAEAEASLRTALRINPGFAEACNNLGYILQDQGRLAEAEILLRRAVEIDPQYAGAHNNLGNVLQLQDKLTDAEARYRQTLAIAPDHADAHNNLGVMLHAEGRLGEAQARFLHALEIAPDFAGAYSNLGNTFKDQHRLEEAESNYRKSLELVPDNSDVYNNLGLVLKESGRMAEAELSYRRALELKPDSVEALNNLGVLLLTLCRPAEAEAILRQALSISPLHSDAHNSLGVALRDRGLPAEAEKYYRRALEIDPWSAMVHSNLGVALKLLGRLGEAEESYRKALEIKPDYPDVHSNLIFLLDLVEGRGVVEHQAERRRWYEQHGRGLAGAIKPHGNAPDPGRRLRVGYVSADFRRHSAYYTFSPVILHHDREAFEVFCYSGVVVEDDATARLRQAAREWRSTVGVSDDALAEQIRRDGIDILVDLSGHSAGNRLLMFAHKPAPVQVTAWGYATGTGLETMDYFLADPVVVPQEERDLYAEEVVDLPCVFCYEPPGYLPEVSPLPALGGRPFTFGCINRIEKITDRVVALWGRVFAALPEAQLVLKDGTCDDAAVRQQLLVRLGAAGIAAERVRILGHSQHAEHLRTYQEIDAGLDPFPHGGGISTAEALAMGVPVVSLHGDTIASRLTSSALTVLGLPEWVAQTEDEYVHIAVRAARDLPGLARTRAGLRTRLTTSPLGNVKHYTRTVEGAFRSMWIKWCNANLLEGQRIG